MKKRGAHFNRRIDPRAGMQAIAMQRPLDTEQKTDLGIALRISLQALRTGTATEAEFHPIAAAINVSLVLCERGIGSDQLPAIKHAQAGMMRLHARAHATGRWVFDGEAMQAITHAIDLHEAQLASVSRREASDAMREVMRRIHNGDIIEAAA